MREIFFKNKTKIIFFLGCFISLLFFFLFGKYVSSLKVLVLLPLALVSGIGFVSYIKKILPIKNILTFILLSIFFGFWGNTLVIFLWGSLGGCITLNFFVIYFVICVLANSYTYFRLIAENEISDYCKNLRFERIDLFFILIFLLLLCFLLNSGVEAYFPLWDSFTFWAVDAKYIFDNGHFRDGSLVLLANNYLPFFSLQINYVYVLYQRIVEQSASLLSLIYVFLGGGIVFSYVLDIKKSLIKKVLLYTSIFAAIYSFYIIHFLIFSLYADAFLSVVTLVYALILFNKDYKENSYWLRFLLIILLSFTLYLTKTHFLTFMLCFVGFYIFYDRKILLEKVRNLKHCKKEILTFLLLCIISLIVFIYAKKISNETQFVQSVLNKVDLTFNLVINNFVDVIHELIVRIPLLSIITGFLLVISLIIKKGFNHEEVYELGFLIIISVFPMALYTFGIFQLSDSSLLRYLALIYYVIPLVFIKICPNIFVDEKWQEILLVVCIILMQLFLVYKVSIDTGFDFKFNPTTGSYKDFSERDVSGINKDFATHTYYYNLSLEIESLIPKDSSLFIVTYDPARKILTDDFPPAFFIRYYTLYNNKIGSLICKPEECSKLFYSKKINYLFVLSYQDYWSECDNILEKNKNYLINLDKNTLIDGDCIARKGNFTVL